MTLAFLIFLTLSAVLVVLAEKTYRAVIYFGIFSLIISGIYMYLGAPDVAMSEAGISAFATIFLIVCIERFYKETNEEAPVDPPPKKRKRHWLVDLAAFLFAAGLCGLFIYYVPAGEGIKNDINKYLFHFMEDIGGENAVTAIYLGYRVYDTLFEALLLVVAVVAVAHMSWYADVEMREAHRYETETSSVTRFTMRIVCPLILIFGVYFILNGHLTPGGGFLGGIAFATVLICRYLVIGVNDMPVKKIIKLEEMVFVSIVLLSAIAIFMGLIYVWADLAFIKQTVYLVSMNALIGVKVASGFIVLFYRCVAVERFYQAPEKGT